MTGSEIVVTGLIWLLAASGGFFGLRAAWRRRRAARQQKSPERGPLSGRH